MRPTTRQVGKKPELKVDTVAVKGLVHKLKEFLTPFLTVFKRSEPREHAHRVVRGLLSDLPRKSLEPIAQLHGIHRVGLQRFVGAGRWPDKPMLETLQSAVNQQMGDENEGIIAGDGVGFPKKGTSSAGVTRQWCGRLGKVEKCQVGIFLSYAGPSGTTLINHRLALPEKWATSRWRKRMCGIPRDVKYRTHWEHFDDLLLECSDKIRHGWIGGDAEFGRCGEFRDRLNGRSERYLLEVPSDLHCRVWNKGVYAPAIGEVGVWAGTLPESCWTVLNVRNGTKGDHFVKATKIRIATRRDDGTIRDETLVVTKTIDPTPDTKYYVTNAAVDMPLGKLVQVGMRRHKIEECFQRGKSELGMDHYEVRTWTGWHHHMTFVLLALWFLVLQQNNLLRSFSPLDHTLAPVCNGRAHSQPGPTTRSPGKEGHTTYVSHP